MQRTVHATPSGDDDRAPLDTNAIWRAVEHRQDVVDGNFPRATIGLRAESYHTRRSDGQRSGHLDDTHGLQSGEDRRVCRVVEPQVDARVEGLRSEEELLSHHHRDPVRSVRERYRVDGGVEPTTTYLGPGDLVHQWIPSVGYRPVLELVGDGRVGAEVGEVGSGSEGDGYGSGPGGQVPVGLVTGDQEQGLGYTMHVELEIQVDVVSAGLRWSWWRRWCRRRRLPVRLFPRQEQWSRRVLLESYEGCHLLKEVCISSGYVT